ncbi:MAG: penicillin-binding protein 2, partial [Eggerthellaceae bacterium]|nr:penicillin-binding protein 2 [Eggerthellaceae bacterium]
SSTHGMVIDASSGEILAIASLPLFNPADTSEVAEGATTLKGISWTYEPGSTFKTITATSLLENHAMEPTDEIYAPIYIEANDRKVTDTEVRDDEFMTLNHIIGASSNVGTALAVEEKLGFDVLYRDILRYHMIEPTGVDFPGEAEGYMDDFDTWTRIQGYNIAFGQGISVTPIRMALFYCALANGGVACTPHFLLTNITTGEDAVFGSEVVIPDAETVDKVAGVLRHVVVGGTSPQANIPGYYVVGKSGTAEIFNGVEYLKDDFNRSFIGYLVEASMPIVVYFCANDVPFEGNVAPAAFRTIMKTVVERYRVTSKWDGHERD